MKDRSIVDSHVHITSPEIIADQIKYRECEPYFDLLSSSPKNKFLTSEDLIKQMEQTGLCQAVVFGFGFASMELCRKANVYTIKSVKKNPEKLIGFATVNPTAPDLKEELERCLTGGLKGVGEIMPEGQNVDITDIKVMKTLCSFCADHGWPVLVHLNELVGHYYPGKTRDSVREGAILAENFPDTKFIFAHLGGGLCFYEAMPEVKKALKNVYYDTAAVPFLYDNKIYDVLKSLGVVDKILFGSDYPLLSPVVYQENIENSSLNEQEKERIYSKNLTEILKH